LRLSKDPRKILRAPGKKFKRAGVDLSQRAGAETPWLSGTLLGYRLTSEENPPTRVSAGPCDRVANLPVREREHRSVGVPVLERDERVDLVEELVGHR
jgi:hypothetical protein